MLLCALFPHLTIKTGKLKPDGYPANPQTIGEHIRKRRMDRGLLQKEVAEQIGVTEDCITLWESNKSNPHVSYYPKIIDFLGYLPIEFDTSTLTGRIKEYRYKHGLTQEDLALNLKINESTVYHIEKGTHKPSVKTLTRLLEMLNPDSLCIQD